MMTDVGLAHAWNTGVSTDPAGQWYVGIMIATASPARATDKPSPHVHPDDPSSSSNLREVRPVNWDDLRHHRSRPDPDDRPVMPEPRHVRRSASNTRLLQFPNLRRLYPR